MVYFLGLKIRKLYLLMVDLAVVHQKQAHLGDVLDIDEIARLSAIGVVRSVRPEQLHSTGGSNLIERMKHHTRHAAFVVFIGAKYVEKLQARPKVRGPTGSCLCQRPPIEVVFGIAVGIERGQLVHDCMIIRVAVFAPAIGGG